MTFRDKSKGKIVWKCVRKSSTIQNVYLLDGLKHNLLSISQLCDINKRIVLNHLGAKFKIEVLKICCFVAIVRIMFTSSMLMSLMKPRLYVSLRF